MSATPYVMVANGPRRVFAFVASSFHFMRHINDKSKDKDKTAKDKEKEKEKSKSKDKDKGKSSKKDATKGDNTKDQDQSDKVKEEEVPEGPIVSLQSDLLQRIVSQLPLATTIRAGTVAKTWYKESAKILKGLTRLDFRSSYPQLDESILKHLLTKRVVAESLTECHLVSFPHLTDKCLKIIADQCPNLTLLNIAQSANITSEGLKHLGSKLAKLTWLDVSHTPITEKGIRAFTKLGTTLKHLRMADGVLVSDRSLEALPSLFPQLETLDISRCPQIDDACIVALQQLPHLQELSMTWMKGLSPHGITRLCTPPSAAASTAAGSGSGEGEGDTTGEGVPSPSVDAGSTKQNFFTSLQYLDLTGNELTNANMLLICRTFPNLKTLKIGWCEVSDEGLAALGQLTQLEYLAIEYTHATQKALRALASLAPHLQCVQIYGTEISKKGRTSFVSKRKDVKLVQHFLG